MLPHNELSIFLVYKKALGPLGPDACQQKRNVEIVAFPVDNSILTLQQLQANLLLKIITTIVNCYCY